MTDLLSFSGLDDGLLYGAERGLSFTVTGGQVTAVTETFGTHTVNLHIPHGATFTVGAGQITETLTSHGQTTVVTYMPESANAALYEVSNVTTTVTTPTTSLGHNVSSGVSFTITGGEVTGEQSVTSNANHSFSNTVHIPTDATFSVGSGTVTETVVEGNAVVATSYVQPSGSSLYAVSSVSTTFIDPGSATTLLNVDSGDRMEFTIDGSGTVTAESRVSAKGTVTSFTPDSHTTFTQLASGLVEEVTTHGAHSSYEVFYAGQDSNGIYTEVAHGSGSTVDVTGLEAQLNQLPAASLHII